MSKISAARAPARDLNKATLLADRESIRLVCMALMLALVALVVQIANVF